MTFSGNLLFPHFFQVPKTEHCELQSNALFVSLNRACFRLFWVSALRIISFSDFRQFSIIFWKYPDTLEFDFNMKRRSIHLIAIGLLISERKPSRLIYSNVLENYKPLENEENPLVCFKVCQWSIFLVDCFKPDKQIFSFYSWMTENEKLAD